MISVVIHTNDSSSDDLSDVITIFALGREG